MITLKRDSGYADKLRKYKVILDGYHIDDILDGETKILNIPDGQHELYLKIDWALSNKIQFDSNGEFIEFTCVSSLRGHKILLALFYTLFMPHKYLWLKMKNNP